MLRHLRGMTNRTTDTSANAANELKPLTVTVATARKISGLGNTTVYALIKDRKLEVVHVGRRTLITFRSLEALLAPSAPPAVPPSEQKNG
jgi:excisionase family DNA binding protein